MHSPTLRLPLISLQTATFVSWLGDGMSNLALPWFVLQATGSPTQTGFSALARALGVYGATTISGPYVDRFPGKRLSIGCDVGAGLAMMAIPLLFATSGLDSGQLYILIFIASIVQRPGFLARSRSLPEIAAASGVTLERASGFNEVIYQATLLAGPAVAGVLVVWLGSSWVLALDALTFFGSALIVALGIPGKLMSTQTASDNNQGWSYRARFAEGIRFLKSDRLLISMVSTVALGILLVNAPLMSVILQVYARQSLGRAVELGLLFSCFAIGAIAGAAVFTWIGEKLPTRVVWTAAYGLICLPYAAIVLDLPAIVIAASMTLFGLAEGISTPLYATVRFRRVPAELRGRAFSALTPVTGLAPTLGLLIPSLLLEPLGVAGVALLLLVLMVGVWFWIASSPTFRQLDSR